MRSKIFLGKVKHIRFHPIRHSFEYPIYTYGLDIQNLKILDKKLSLFGYKKINVSSIYDKDYIVPGYSSIYNKLIKLLEKQSIKTEEIKNVFLISSARYFNYIFNPVNFYYCLNEEKTPIAIVAEVNNTFGEKHLYIFNTFAI